MKRRSIKSESRILVIHKHGSTYYLMVFRKNFLEEFSVLDEREVPDISRVLDHLVTREEVSYYLLCDENKYGRVIPGLKILEGSEYLLRRNNYCRELSLIARCFENIRIGGFTNCCGGDRYG